MALDLLPRPEDIVERLLPHIDPYVFQDVVLRDIGSVLQDGIGPFGLERPVLPAIHSYMSPDLVGLSDGRVLLVYEKPIEVPIWWAEYDDDVRQLSFVTVRGEVIPFGQKIEDQMVPFLLPAQHVIMVQIDAGGQPVQITAQRLLVRSDKKI